MNSYSGDQNMRTGKPASCVCGLCFEAPEWPDNQTNCDTDEVLTNDSLSRQVMNLYETTKQRDDTRWAKEDFRQGLENILQDKGQSLGLHNPQVVITGSTKYQMALDDSDLDLCITTLSSCTYNKKSILISLGRAMRENGLIQSEPIIHGKQRVVMKCTASISGRKFRVDIQIMDVIYNMNFQEPIITTNILVSLASVDRRFPILATIVKLWSKRNNIHDASEWRLSSYSLVLMLVQYLQVACNPPILPLIETNTPAEIIATFENKQYHSANGQSLGDLLIGFFRFYSEQFDFDKQFVTVGRAGQRCRRFLYCPNYICVQDPFTKKNAAQCVKYGEMYQRIKTAFQSSHLALSRDGNLNLIM